VDEVVASAARSPIPRSRTAIACSRGPAERNKLEAGGVEAAEREPEPELAELGECVAAVPPLDERLEAGETIREDARRLGRQSKAAAG
jgi:hypothetical protein